MNKIITICLLGIIGLTLNGCFTPTGLNSTEQKKYARDMANSTLEELYQNHPETKSVIDKASGYVVYNTYAIDCLFLATEHGWGVAFNKSTGEYFYLKDLSFGVGPCLGFAIMRNILVFDNEIEFNAFVNGAWSLNVKADAVARVSDDGTWHLADGANMTNGARVYKLGNRGLIVEAILDVSKSWENRSLAE